MRDGTADINRNAFIPWVKGTKITGTDGITRFENGSTICVGPRLRTYLLRFIRRSSEVNFIKALQTMKLTGKHRGLIVAGDGDRPPGAKVGCFRRLI